jgi:hypothetical protein
MFRTEYSFVSKSIGSAHKVQLSSSSTLWMKALTTVGVRTLNNKTIRLETNQTLFLVLRLFFYVFQRRLLRDIKIIIQTSLVSPVTLLVFHKSYLFFRKVISLLVTVIIDILLSLRQGTAQKRIFFFRKKISISNVF